MTEKTDRTSCRSKGINTKLYVKSELFRRKTEETSHTDRPKEKFQQEETQLKPTNHRNWSYRFKEG